MHDECCLGCGRPGLHTHGRHGLKRRCRPEPKDCPAFSERQKALAAASRARFYGKVRAQAGEPEPCACGEPGRVFSPYYRTWRCTEVVGDCPAHREKVEQGMLAAHGTTKAAHIEGVQAKRSETLRKTHAARGEEGRKAIAAKRSATIRDRFGVDNPSQRPEHWEGIKERHRAETGVDHWLQTPEGLAKQRATVEARYGADHVQRVPAIRAKTEATNVERYGVIAPLQNPEVVQRWRATLLERYGADALMHSPTIFAKQQEALYRRKDFLLPSGRMVIVRGYEGHALIFLFRLGYAEDHLDLASGTPVRVPYTDPTTGKRRVYYPDIHIRTRHHLVEVKSPFTLYNEAAYPVNLAKRDACVAAGWRFTFLVMESDGSVVEQLGDPLE